MKTTTATPHPQARDWCICLEAAVEQPHLCTAALVDMPVTLRVVAACRRCDRETSYPLTEQTLALREMLSHVLFAHPESAGHDDNG